MQQVHNFAPIGDNVPRVSAVLRDLTRRLLEGVEGEPELPEWARKLVCEGMANAGFGGNPVAVPATLPVPLTGGHIIQGAGAAEAPVEIDQELPPPPEKPDDAAKEDEAEADEPGQKEQDSAEKDVDGSASDVPLLTDDVPPVPEVVPPADDAPPDEAKAGEADSGDIEQIVRDSATEL